jgi:type II secretory pathway pseudopilin PulG
MGNKVKILKRYFTLIELMAAMGVFAIIMLIMLSFFSSAQKAWTNCINRGQVYENARIAMDLISRDLQCVYYEKDKVPFWHKGYTNYKSSILAYAVYDQEALCFVSVTNVAPDGCQSKICEVKYQLYNYDPTIASPDNGDPKCEGWLLRSATGDASSPVSKWNYYISTTPWPAGAGQIVNDTGSSCVFSADKSSSEEFQKVIPYVTNLSFTCYKRDETTEIPSDLVGDGFTPYKMTFPYSVRVELSLMDQQSWLKWKAMGGKRYITGGALLPDPQNDFRTKNERTFTKTIVLGERGQN